MESGFYKYFNYGGYQPFKGGPVYGSSKMFTGYRWVYASVGNKWVQILDWGSGQKTKVDRKDFEKNAVPVTPLLKVIKRCLKNLTKKRQDTSPEGKPIEYRILAKTGLVKEAMKAAGN